MVELYLATCVQLRDNSKQRTRPAHAPFKSEYTHIRPVRRVFYLIHSQCVGWGAIFDGRRDARDAACTTDEL